MSDVTVQGSSVPEVKERRKREIPAPLFRDRSRPAQIILGGVVPFLFEGRLPDLNLGTAAGASCSAGLQQRLVAVLEAQREYSFAINGRFKLLKVSANKRHTPQSDKSMARHFRRKAGMPHRNTNARTVAPAATSRLRFGNAGRKSAPLVAATVVTVAVCGTLVVQP